MTSSDGPRLEGSGGAGPPPDPPWDVDFLMPVGSGGGCLGLGLVVIGFNSLVCLIYVLVTQWNVQPLLTIGAVVGIISLIVVARYTASAPYLRWLRNKREWDRLYLDRQEAQRKYDAEQAEDE